MHVYTHTHTHTHTHIQWEGTCVHHFTFCWNSDYVCKALGCLWRTGEAGGNALHSDIRKCSPVAPCRAELTSCGLQYAWRMLFQLLIERDWGLKEGLGQKWLMGKISSLSKKDRRKKDCILYSSNGYIQPGEKNCSIFAAMRGVRENNRKTAHLRTWSHCWTETTDLGQLCIWITFYMR